LINGEGYQFSECRVAARPRKPLRIGYVGRLLKSKAVDRLIEAATLSSGCRLTLIGDIDFGNSDGIDANWLEEQIANSDGKLVHTGFVDDVKAVLKDIDIVVSMSIREGLPFAVLDAIDSGCLAILSPVPGHKSFDGIDGVLFTHVDNLPVILQSIADTPEIYFQYDQDIRKAICIRQFGIEVVTQVIANFLVKERTSGYGKVSGR
jgi:glycosyltransferase involved in cell wall biosynthesis